MYNEEVKLLFVTEEVRSESVEKKYRSIFRNVGPYEEKLGKDVGEMNREELIGAGELIFGTRMRSGINLLSNLTAYVRWYRETVLGEKPPVLPDLSGHVFGSEKLREKMFLSPAHLSKYLTTVCRDDSDQSKDVFTKSAAWLIYAGLFVTELPELKRSDLDLDNLCVHFGGREYPVYPQAVKTLKTCRDMDDVVVFSEFNGKERRASLGRAGGDALFRGAERGGVALNASTLMNQISRMRKSAFGHVVTGMRPTADGIWFSGLFYRMREAEIIGDWYDIREDAARLQGRTNPGAAENRRHNVTETAWRIRMDYDRWKGLF